MIRPGVSAGLAGPRHGVAPPQPLAVVRIVTFDVAAAAVFGAGHAGDQHAVGDQRCAGHGDAVLGFARFDAPDLLAGLHVEGDDARIERGAEDFALVDRGAAVDDAAADHARRVGRILDRRIPDFLAGERIDGNRLVLAGDVYDAVINERLGLLAGIVVHAV